MTSEKEKPDKRGTPPGGGTIMPEHGGRIGNPPFVATQEQRDTVKLYAKVMSNEMIASALDISVDTLMRHFRSELDEGKREAVAAVGGKLLAKALAGNVPSMIFYLKTRGKWNSRLEITGADGGPIKHVDLSAALASMTDEQLQAIEPLLEQLLVASGSPDLDSGAQISAGTGQGGDPAPGT